MPKNVRGIFRIGLSLAVLLSFVEMTEAQPAGHPSEELMMRRNVPPEANRLFPHEGPAPLGYMLSVSPDTSETLGMVFPPPFEIPEIVRFTAKEFPDLHARFQADSIASEREKYETILYLKQMMELRDTNPEMFKMEKTIHLMEVECDTLGETIRKQPDKNTKEQCNALEEKLSALFDLREERREMEAQQIEADLEHVRALLKQRRENRDAIIEKRLKELIGANDGVEW